MINFSSTAAGNLMTALKAAIDVGGSAGSIDFYNGTRPTTGGTPSGTLIVNTPLAYPCGTVSGGTLTFAAGANGLISASSTPTWARIKTSAGAFVADCNCRLVGASPATDPEEIVLNATSILTGAYVAISGGAISAPT